MTAFQLAGFGLNNSAISMVVVEEEEVGTFVSVLVAEELKEERPCLLVETPAPISGKASAVKLVVVAKKKASRRSAQHTKRNRSFVCCGDMVCSRRLFFRWKMYIGECNGILPTTGMQQ